MVKHPRPEENPARSSRNSKRTQGLPRPRKIVSYGIPTITQTADTSTKAIKTASKDSWNRDRTSTPSSGSVSDTIGALSKVHLLLNLIHRRNKNQHRNQPFFKHINLLRRAVRQLTQIHQHRLSLEGSPQISRSGSDSAKGRAHPEPSKAEDVRRNFERQAELRSQRELHEEWTRETLIPSAYIAFSSLVANDQFANLALVLMGLLSDIASIVGTPKRIDRLVLMKSSRSIGTIASNHVPGFKSLLGTSTIETGSGLGEVTERLYNSGSGRDSIDTDQTTDFGTPVERSLVKDNVRATSTAKETTTQDTAKRSRPVSGKSVMPIMQTAEARRASSSENTSTKQQETRVPKAQGRPYGTAMGKSSLAVPDVKRDTAEPIRSTYQNKPDDHQSKVTKKKKKKSPKNAIDDLFSGFG